MSTPGYFPGHSSAGRLRLGTSKEAIGVLPGSDCSLSAHLEPVVLDHGDPHGPRGARSSLLPALTSVGRCPKGPESGVVRRLVAWPGLAGCLSGVQRAMSQQLRQRMVGWHPRGIRFMTFPANSNPPLAAVASHPRVRHPLSAARLPIALEFRRSGATNRLADAARRGRTRGEHQSPSDPDRRVLVLPLSVLR